MRKVIYLLVSCMLMTNALFAQVRFGVQGSGQFANIVASVSQGQGATSYTDYSKQRLGFRAGVMADIPVSEQLSVRPQLLYSVKGTKLNLGGLLGGVPTGVDPNQLDLTLNYNFLELPVQVMYGLDAGPGRVMLGAGPYAAYLLGVSNTFDGKTLKDDLADEKRIDYGLNASAGYELPMGITVSAYYSLGLANLAAGSTIPSTGSAANTGGAYHRAFGLSVGYFFGGN
ncbi:porin family protein [Fibrella sp. WM1]|uniref:porin family protein n=1 Tax=Fibrella musci TaxID=3242485 RepID=UPI003522F9CA